MTGKYSFFKAENVKPRGWLRRQLLLEAQGLCGNLDKVWPDVRDSAWIGGNCEGWERVPYWLDGFVPLAYLLEDQDMIQRAKFYVDKILEHQQADGWICPVEPEKRAKYDTWAVLLICKVLVRYYECSKDDRIPTVVYRVMKNFYELLLRKEVSVFAWGSHRWYEVFPALNFLWELHGEAWIKELARLLKQYSFDYHQAETLWERPLNRWRYDTHIVNLCQMLKSEVLSCDLLGERESGSAEHFYQILKRTNGTAVGTFTGDECLSGISPTQGTELCSVVELMDSMEQIYAYTGDPVWAERLETIAFNALPATVSEDMWAHQYVQMVNQIDCTPFPGKSHFRTNNNEAHRFGLEPHYGCCTANFGQGWPKLALSTFMKDEDGILSSVPIPSEIQTIWDHTQVKITLDSDYPFRNHFRYTVDCENDTDMKLLIRIPSFAKNLQVNEKNAIPENGLIVIDGFTKGTTDITVSFTTTPVLEQRPNDMTCLRYGSLIFSFPIEAEIKRVEYEKSGVVRKYPYCDYDYKGTSDWNVAFTNQKFKVEECEINEIPFSQKHPPLKIKTDLCHIDWGLADGYETVCAAVPENRIPLDEATERELIPYGCARLRMTELPKI